jgi:hypothetical protein
MKAVAIFIAALAATSISRAQTVTVDGLQLVARPATVRVNEITEVDMVWQFIDGGTKSEMRIGVTGCDAGQGELIFIDANGARVYHEVMEWYGGDDGDIFAEIARVTCEVASHM